MSQGTTSLMALLSSRPEYNSKIIQAHLFAPVAFCKYIPNEWIKASMVPLLELLDERSVEIFNFTKIFTAVSPLTRIFCDYRISPGTTEICKAVIFSITGNNVEREELDQVNKFKMEISDCWKWPIDWDYKFMYELLLDWNSAFRIFYQP